MSGMKAVALTRPLADSRRLAAELASKGIPTFSVPMLTIEPCPEFSTAWNSLNNAKLQAIIVTSRHAVEAMKQEEGRRDVTLFAVGMATAQEAKLAGFQHVWSAEGHAASLMEHIRAANKPGGGLILYVRGRDITRDLAGELRAEGYDVVEMQAYRAELSDHLPDDYLQALRSGQIGEVWFYSIRSAEHYVELAERYGVSALHAGITAATLSDAISLRVTGLPWGSFRLIATP